MSNALKKRLVNLHHQIRADKATHSELVELADLINQRIIPDKDGLTQVKKYLYMLFFQAYPALLEDKYNLTLCQQLKQECENDELSVKTKNQPRRKR